MAFTYDLTETGLSLAYSQIRLEIGDTDNATDQGVKPDGTNFTDAELDYFYDAEASSVLAAAARALEVLARMYARLSESVRLPDGTTIDPKDRAQALRLEAKALRQRAGNQYLSGSAPLTRVDGYSSTVNSRQNEAESGEYGGRIVIKRLK